MLVINVLFSGVLWLKTRNHLYRYLCLTWVGSSLVYASSALIAASSAEILKILPTVPGFIEPLMLAQLLATIVDFKFRWQPFVLIELAGFVVTMGLYALGVNIHLAVFPAILTYVLPVLYVTWFATRSPCRERLTFVSGCFALSLVFWALHDLDYAYAIDKPGLMFAGFTLAFVLLTATSTFATASILEAVSAEVARVQMEAKFEAMMAHSAKMAALGEMAGGIAHEINNPLAIISSASHLVLQTIETGPTDKVLARDMLINIMATVQRIAKILQGLRFFTRNAAQDPIQSFLVQRLIEDTLSLCEERFKALGVQVRVGEIGQELRVTGRPVEISQVLLNLLNNSYDAVQQLAEKWIAISVSERHDMIEIGVTDSGCGIPALVREKIFQPFFSTKEVGKGTGLGLSISKGIAESHGGKLILNEESCNTQFVLALPALRA